MSNFLFLIVIGIYLFAEVLSYIAASLIELFVWLIDHFPGQKDVNPRWVKPLHFAADCIRAELFIGLAAFIFMPGSSLSPIVIGTVIGGAIILGIHSALLISELAFPRENQHADWRSVIGYLREPQPVAASPAFVMGQGDGNEN